MFANIGDKLQMLKKMQSMMMDENFRNFISHPKIREIMQDPELKSDMQSQNFSNLTSNPKFAQTLRDPEVATLLAKLDLKKIMS